MGKLERIAKKVMANATCEYCGREMDGTGCDKHWYFIDGKMYEAVRFGDPMENLPDDIVECHDCGVKRGEYHHYGCDMERCPKCGKQLIGFHGCHISDKVITEKDTEEE